MRGFIKLSFDDAVWCELVCADLEGNVVVLHEDGLERVPPDKILDEYYEDFDGPVAA